MSSQASIKHKGTVREVSGSQVRVKIDPKTACGSCQAKSSCSLAEMEEKIIDVKETKEKFSVGEEVEVTLSQTLGFKALFYGYILPFIVVVTVLITLIAVTGNEALSGITALLFLVPYYATLHFFRDKLKKEFSFTINKPVNN